MLPDWWFSCSTTPHKLGSSFSPRISISENWLFISTAFLQDSKMAATAQASCPQRFPKQERKDKESQRVSPNVFCHDKKDFPVHVTGHTGSHAYPKRIPSREEWVYWPLKLGEGSPLLVSRNLYPNTEIGLCSQKRRRDLLGR